MNARIIGVNVSINGSRIMPFNCVPGALHKGAMTILGALLLGLIDIAARDEEKERLNSSILYLSTPMSSSVPEIESFRA